MSAGEVEEWGMDQIRRLLLIFTFFFLLGSVPCLAFECHVLDVGQGQSVLIEADGHYMLIDGGGRDASSFVVSHSHIGFCTYENRL